MKVSDPATAFRLPKAILATVDAICAKEDLTRSQVFRRSVMEYLKRQNAIATDVSPPAQRAGRLSFLNVSAEGLKNEEKNTGSNDNEAS